MPLSERFQRQVTLLIAAMPFVAAERDFALKGGTAINLFVRDMPRLSVDMDLTYLPVAPRAASLAAIDAGMKRMAAAIRSGLRGVDRPVAEVIAPRRKDIRREFERGFDGMAADPVSLDELLASREALIAEMAGRMPDAHRAFLLGFKRGQPDWELLGLAGAAELPAVRWKQLYLDRLDAPARTQLVARLEAVLSS